MGLFTSLILKSNQESEQDEYLVGEYSWESWKQRTGWSDSNEDFDVDEFYIDADILEKLKSKLKNPNIRFLFFIAEWCGDSYTSAPKVMNLLKLCEIPNTRIQLIGVSRDKMLPPIAFKNNIYSIPTLVVFFNEYEIGRIDEYPAVSWSIDLLKIISDF